MKNQNVRFRATGVVIGQLWGGGMATYPARKLFSATKKDILKQAKDGLDGSLDSGMGFDHLTGAMIVIETITEKIIGKKTFTNNSFSDSIFIGKVSEKEQEFILDYFYQS